MNLVMCCTDINHQHDYEDQLRFALFSALFFKRTYPDGQVYIATTPKAVVPAYYKQFFRVVRFDFEKELFALSRMMLYQQFIASELMTDDTAFVGSDVVFGKHPFPALEANKMTLSYRYHPSQPYCADLIVARKGEEKFATEFFDTLIKMIAYLPRKIRMFWADQIALAIEVGKLMPDDFDGKMHRSPRYPDILLAPGDDYLYTPNDIFTSLRRADTSFKTTIKDVKDTNQLQRLLFTKHAIHFKGPRKPWMITLAYLAWQKKWIDPYQFGAGPDPEQLFKGVFEQERQAA